MAIRPGISKYDHEIELTDTKSKKKYMLKVPQGSLQIGTISQDDTIFIRNVGKRVGDFDEQRSWKSGRGTENLSDNAEAYWDSLNCWTLTPGHVHQTLQWYHARGLRNEDMYMPTYSVGDVEFVPLLGSQLYIASSFSASASYNAKQGYLWIRRRGSPGSITFRLMDNSAGNPGSALKTVSKSISDITDLVSVYQLFQWSGTESLTSSTTYWVSVNGDTADDQDNHWEVGVDTSTQNSKISSAGSSWASGSFSLYYRVTDADVNRRWYRFNLKDAYYIIDSKDNETTASKLYINGDRGMATAGSSTTLTDSAKTWTVNRWTNAYVRIVDGQGRLNTPAKILSNTATELTIDGEWDSQNPSTTSQYVIYAAEWFTEISLSGASLSVVTGEPAVANNVAYIPQGTTAFLHVQWNTTTFAHDAFQETSSGVNGEADFFLAANDNADGPVIWRGNNSGGTGSGGKVTVSRANLLSSGAFIAWNTALSFKTAIFTGSTSYLLTNVIKKGEEIYAFREDGMGLILNDRYKQVDTGVDKTPSRANGALAIAHGQFLYYSWLHTLVRVYGASHDDIGDDYRGIGLPDSREGQYIDADSYLKLVFFGINAHSGTSSVMAWDGTGWHEVFRNKRAGKAIRMVKIQVCPETLNRLWIDTGGGDLVFQMLPLFKSSPRLATGSRYMHEGVVESATIDMGTASGLAKFIKELTVTVSNLNTPGREIFVDIQTDKDVHTSTWTFVDVMRKSPESTVFLGLENVRRFVYRLRLCSNSNRTPVDVEGVVPNGYARVPFKMVFTMQIQAGGIFSRRGKLASSDELMRWLLDTARRPGRVRMDSVFEMAHNWYVIVHPPGQFPLVPRKGRNPETANFTLVLQEA